MAGLCRVLFQAWVIDFSPLSAAVDSALFEWSELLDCSLGEVIDSDSKATSAVTAVPAGDVRSSGDDNGADSGSSRLESSPAQSTRVDAVLDLTNGNDAAAVLHPQVTASSGLRFAFRVTGKDTPVCAVAV